ncbi:MAG TPA: type II secretion system protein [Candidatus Binatia bacterium]|jgi:hypothetical protein|nr:type II secretion system protein [Candidatus Binatia bacterium]
MRRRGCQKVAALTVPELLIVMGVLAILALVLLPPLARSHRSPSHSRCLSNQKQISICFKVWANDNNDRYPMQVSTNEGGTLEFVAGGNAFVHFRVMSNELSTPKILLCPADTKRGPAISFDSDFNNSTLSYFVGLEAVPTNAAIFLSGDRSLSNGIGNTGGIMKLSAGQLVSWTKELHSDCGYVSFPDGSVIQLTTAALRKALQRTGVATNLLAIP